MKKTILSLSIILSLNATSENYYSIINNSDFEVQKSDVTAPTAPTIVFVEDENSNDILEVSEIFDVSNISVDFLLDDDVVLGDVLSANYHGDITVTSEHISSEKITLSYPTPEYGDSVSVNATLTDLSGNTSTESVKSATTELTVNTSTLEGRRYSNDAILLETSSIFNNYTMEAWVKPQKTITTGTVMSNTGVSGVSGESYLFYPLHGGAINDSVEGIGLSIGTNGIKVFAHSAGSLPALFVQYMPISSTEWTHVALVVDNNQPIVYINGSYLGTGLVPAKGTSFSSNSIGDFYSYGKLDADVAIARIWDNKLTASEISNSFDKHLKINEVVGDATLVEIKHQY